MCCEHVTLTQPRLHVLRSQASCLNLGDSDSGPCKISKGAESLWYWWGGGLVPGGIRRADADAQIRFVLSMNISEKQRFIASQPRPRMVQLSRRGKSWVLLLAIILAAIEAGLVIYLCMLARWTNSLASIVKENGLAFYSALLLPFLPLVFSRGLRREKELIRNGEVAVAKVTSTSNSPGKRRNDDVRTVEYQFSDASGALMMGVSVDSTLMLREESAMLVYYDADDPSQQVAQCAAYYQVEAPGLEPDWIDETG